MKAMRLSATVILFMVAMSLNSFGYSVLCQSLPVSISVNNVYKNLFTCAIPANAVGKGQSIRVTAFLHPVNSGPLYSNLEFNGNVVDSSSTLISNELGWSFTVTNIGGTGFSIGGTATSGQSIFAFGPQTGSQPAVPWSSGWTLEIMVAYGTGTYYTADGDTFTVEILK